MTKVAITSNASGAGTFTLSAPNSDTDRTVSLPDATGTVFLSDAFNTIQPSNISDGTTTVGTEYVVNGSAKAWVRYNATTPAVNEDSNVSSITDNGTGYFTINLTNAFTSATYARTGSWGNGSRGTTATTWRPVAISTSDFEVSTTANSSVADSYLDGTDTNAVAYGDLA